MRPSEGLRKEAECHSATFRLFAISEPFSGFWKSAASLARIGEPISLVHDLTEVHRRVLLAGGPALLFENAAGARMPVLANLFGTAERVAAGFGVAADAGWRTRRDAGRLARAGALRRPAGCARAAGRWSARRSRPGRASCRGPTARRSGGSDADVDLGLLPIQTCWPGEPAPLITWPLVDHPAARHRGRRHGAHEHRRLSHAGPGQGPRHHALAAASRRRRASSGVERAGQGHAGRGGDRRRSGDHPLGRPAVAGDGVGTALLRACCAASGRASRLR